MKHSPLPFLTIGSRIRKSPFFDAAQMDGMTHCSVYNHMYMPISYGDAKAEYESLYNGVVMWDVGAERQVRLKGKDAIKLARLLTPRNLGKLIYGAGRYVPLCNFQGTIINDPVLLRVDEDEVWLSIADSDVCLWAQAIAGAYNLDVRVTEPDISPLAIQGPKAISVITDLFGSPAQQLKYFGFYHTQLQGIPLVVARSGWSKQGGYELYLMDGSKGTQLWNIVKEAGKPYHIRPGAPNHTERIESGLISYGTDTDNATNPYEIGLGKYVQLNREDNFIGKDALKTIKMQGVQRKFTGLWLEDNPQITTNTQRYTVYANDTSVGFVSAMTHSPRFDKSIALALLSKETVEQCQTVHIDIEGRRIQAIPTPTPFQKLT